MIGINIHRVTDAISLSFGDPQAGAGFDAVVIKTAKGDARLFLPYGTGELVATAIKNAITDDVKTILDNVQAAMAAQ